MNKFFYPAVFHPEDIGFSVSVPDIEGCFTQGDNLNEAAAMTQEAIGLMLEDYFVEKKPLPVASAPNELPLNDGDFTVMIEFDRAAYLRRHNRQSVKKTLTIPVWLNQIAEEQGINFSRVLQKALKQELEVQ